MKLNTQECIRCLLAHCNINFSLDDGYLPEDEKVMFLPLSYMNIGFGANIANN
jgi:hypothetical protein